MYIGTTNRKQWISKFFFFSFFFIESTVFFLVFLFVVCGLVAGVKWYLKKTGRNNFVFFKFFILLIDFVDACFVWIHYLINTPDVVHILQLLTLLFHIILEIKQQWNMALGNIASMKIAVTPQTCIEVFFCSIN